MIKYRKAASTAFPMMNTWIFETCRRQCSYFFLIVAPCILVSSESFIYQQMHFIAVIMYCVVVWQHAATPPHST